MSVHNYQKIFDSFEGSLREKMCYLLTQYSQHWEWAGHGSMVSDILDNAQLTPEEIVHILEGVQDFEGGNDGFRAALNVVIASILPR